MGQINKRFEIFESLKIPFLRHEYMMPNRNNRYKSVNRKYSIRSNLCEKKSQIEKSNNTSTNNSAKCVLEEEQSTNTSEADYMSSNELSGEALVVNISLI